MAVSWPTAVLGVALQVPCRCLCSAFAVHLMIVGVVMIQECPTGSSCPATCRNNIPNRQQLLTQMAAATVAFSHLIARAACDLLCCLLLAALGSHTLPRRNHTTRSVRRPTAHSWGKAALRCACAEPVSGVGPRTPGRVRIVLCLGCGLALKGRKARRGVTQNGSGLKRRLRFIFHWVADTDTGCPCWQGGHVSAMWRTREHMPILRGRGAGHHPRREC